MRILVVEDETAVRESLKQQLAGTGFSVDIASDGEEGLFAGLHYPLDAAIVDVGLPKRAGLDVIREWRASERNFPVVVLTARNSWQDRVEGLGAGADDCNIIAQIIFRLRGRKHPNLKSRIATSSQIALRFTRASSFAASSLRSL